MKSTVLRDIRSSIERGITKSKGINIRRGIRRNISKSKRISIRKSTRESIKQTIRIDRKEEHEEDDNKLEHPSQHLVVGALIF